MRRHALRATVVALALALLTACGGGSGEVSEEHSSADVTFVQQMIPHHEQAVEMADLASRQGAGPEVRSLATTIEKAQGPEITQMTSWLKAWGEKVPSGGMSGMSGQMEGMMTTQQMDELSTARGAAFDDLFLTRMIAHHTGALAMAKKEQASGTSPDAVDLAKDVEKTQTAEIATMRRLLAAG